MILIRNGEVFGPRAMGRCDILTGGAKILAIEKNIHAEGLPLRKAQSGKIVVTAADQDPISIALHLQVSIVREIWRLTRRALAAALPESLKTARTGWRIYSRVMTFLSLPFRRFPWLVTVLWLLLSVGTGFGLYYLPTGVIIPLPRFPVVHPSSWQGYVLPVALGPPLFLLTIWAIFLVALVVGGALYGIFRGAWKSFTR